MSIQLKRMKFEFEPLIKEMLDKMPNSVWESNSTVFLDPEIGGGQIAAAIEQKLRSYGYSDENIAKRVYGISSNKYIIDVAVRRHALVGTYVVGDFLEGTLNDMKFDVVIGNPPFQNPNNSSSATKLWPMFINMSIDRVKEAGYVALISPNSWTKGGVAPRGSGKILNRFKEYNLIYVDNGDCGRYFDVGVTFSYFVLQKSPSAGSTVIHQNGEDTVIKIDELFTIPKDVKALHLVNRVYTSQHDRIPCKLEVNTVNSKINASKSGRYPVYTSGKFMYTDVDGLDMEEKIVVPWSTSVDKTIMGNFITGDQSVEFKTDGRGKELMSLLTSKLYRFCNEQTRMANHNEGYRFMPLLPLDRVWTDKEIYEQFDMTQEEIELVESYYE